MNSIWNPLPLQPKTNSIIGNASSLWAIINHKDCQKTFTKENKNNAQGMISRYTV